MYGRIPYLNNSLSSWATHCSNLRRLPYYTAVWLGTSPSVPLTGGSYVLAEIDGTMSKLRFAAFRLIPYYACDCRSVPLTCLISEDIDKFIDETHEPGNCIDIWHTIPGPNHPLSLLSSCSWLTRMSVLKIPPSCRDRTLINTKKASSSTKFS